MKFDVSLIILMSQMDFVDVNDRDVPCTYVLNEDLRGDDAMIRCGTHETRVFIYLISYILYLSFFERHKTMNEIKGHTNLECFSFLKPLE